MGKFYYLGDSRRAKLVQIFFSRIIFERLDGR